MIPGDYTAHELGLDDAPAMAAAYFRNREHLAPWEPPRSDSFFTTDGQRTAIETQLQAAAAGQVVSWVLALGDEVVGRINLNNVVMGVLRSANVGYWVDVDHQGRGLASGAVDFAVAEAAERGLHRVEAGTQVHNTASQRVLERNGFEYFGTAPNYLFLGGRWRDHRLYQRILHDRPLQPA